MSTLPGGPAGMPVVVCDDIVSAAGPPLVTGHPVVRMMFTLSFRGDPGDLACSGGAGRAGCNTSCPLARAALAGSLAP
ncbi:MAG TPA: hypothetical protein VF933_28015 [Streptosporangiaceae bacterium]